MRFIKVGISILLMSVVLAYSSGLTIAKHYCRAELVDLAVNAELKKCSDAQLPSAQPEHPVVQKKSCCLDVIANFKLDHQEQTKSVGPQFLALKPIEYFPVCRNNIGFEPQVWTLVQPPPLRSISLYKELECYLI